MAGLYIHIPFCKSRCIYCGFYSTTAHEMKQRYIDAVCKEMRIREHPQEPINTIYIGGGTPSQLSGEQLRQLFACIKDVYGVDNVIETTMEVNPDDIAPNNASTTDSLFVPYTRLLSELPINRISMGAQTFNNKRLEFLHRRHTAEQIPTAVRLLREAGIQNISIDLMYGFPNETLSDWTHDIEMALTLGIEHISAYSLMYEENTPLFHLREESNDSRYKPIDEELELQMFGTLIDHLTTAGYNHYEISNFAKPDFHSRHNSGYWNQTPYIGIGAAAHSYDGKDKRSWNPDNLSQYINAIENGQLPQEVELLDENTRYNDIVMTTLRTRKGLNTFILSKEHADYCLQQAERFIKDGELIIEGTTLRLSRKGLFVSNMIMSELMIV
jgi:oxygen-independent coproporphyrinogen-3 oxidase